MTQPVYPLDVWFCRNCRHLQLLDVVDPEILFRNYVYVSGTSSVFVDHFRHYAKSVGERLGLLPQHFVLDIGSNDGTLLRFFAEHGCRVLGVDPAMDIARAATAAGVETIAEFFGNNIADRICGRYGKADLITANNVFAHIDNLEEVVRAVKNVLHESGVLVIEVSYLLDLIEGTLFDMIYHEHLDYHSLAPLQTFFARLGMELFHAERVSTHGGSIRCFVQVAGGARTISEDLTGLLQLECDSALNEEHTFADFGARIQARGRELRVLLDDLRSKGKKIAGFGAPAKATTLMYQFNISADVIDYIVDDNPLKQGRFTPGLHVPVVSSDRLASQSPDYLIILAWNFADSIMTRYSRFREQGGRFIIPLPELKVV